MFGGAITSDTLTESTRRRAAAEALELTTQLDYAARREAEIEANASSPMYAYVARGSIATEIAGHTGLSEGQVQSRLAVGERVRSSTPRAWAAFTEGRIDLARVREIASAIERLTDPESVAALDEKVVDYADGHTTAELRRWLNRFVLRTEPDQSLQRAEDERKRRYVRVTHEVDGMAHLEAYLPAPAAAAIERRLYREARALTDDGRTLAQKEADLLVAWATSNEAGRPAVHTDIAVIVEADRLDGFAESADGAWLAPVEWVTDIADPDQTFWWRMVTEPVTRDILAIEYQGRYPPDLLRKAIQLRDRTCVHPGCLVPAWKCDLDHVIPWPQGRTVGSNLNAKSRKHHAQKGHGIPPPDAE